MEVYVICLILAIVAVHDVRGSNECQDGWYVWQGRCYLVGNATNGRTWNDAADACKILNASLINIQSKREQTFIRNILMNYEVVVYWIGLSAQLSSVFGSNVWKWTDGSMLMYSNWHSPQYPTSGLCAYHYGYLGTWGTFSCQSNGNDKGFICEKEGNRHNDARVLVRSTTVQTTRDMRSGYGSSSTPRMALDDSTTTAVAVGVVVPVLVIIIVVIIVVVIMKRREVAQPPKFDKSIFADEPSQRADNSYPGCPEPLPMSVEPEPLPMSVELDEADDKLDEKTVTPM